MKRMVTAGGLLASAVLLTGCGLSSITGPASEDTVSYEVTEKVARLQLKSGSGDAEVTGTDGDAVRVVEHLRWRDDNKPETEHKVDGGTLVLTHRCPSDWGSCGVDYEIQVPKGLALDLDSGSGNLTLRGLSGDLDVLVGSGDVDAGGLTGRKVSAETGSGDIEFEYASAPDAVELRAGSGDVQLTVPDEAYDVRTDVGTGDAAVSIRTDGSSPRKISVTTGTGDVTVSPA
jgi:Putative adhesin